MTADRRNKLLERRNQIDAQIKRLDAGKRAQERKDDTRRKIIAGALVLENAEIHPEFGAELMRLLNRYVIKQRDRALFDLPPRSDNEQTPPPKEPATEEQISPGRNFRAVTGADRRSKA